MASKWTSGRWVVLVFCVSTYCVCILGSLILACKKILNIEAFLALFGGLSGLVTMIVTFYYDRKDRNGSGNVDKT